MDLLRTFAVLFSNSIVADVLIKRSPGLVMCRVKLSASTEYISAQVTQDLP